MALDFRDEDIRDNFTKVSFTEAKCKHCNSKFTHTLSKNFFVHMRVNHFETIYDHEEYMVKVKMWRCIRINEERTEYHCVICKQDVVEFIEQNNWSRHVHEDHFLWNYYENWQWKYCEQENDFLAKCYICKAKIPIVFCWNELTKHIKQAHFNLLKTMMLSFKDEEIQAKFTKLTFTVAQCKTCKCIFTHTYMNKFSEHVKTCSNIINLIENAQSYLGHYWKYVRLYRSTFGYQCVLCKTSINFCTNDCFEHLHYEDNFLSSTYYDKWEWKYREIKQKDDSKVKCNLCSSEILIDFCKNYLMNHIRECDSYAR